jgi:8-oxo-dGTP diphosphatase
VTEIEGLARPRVAAGGLFTDETGRVLLVKPTYKDGWEIPGGYVQPGETPRAAVAREIVEELGVALPVGPLLVADWAPSEREGDKLLFVFDGGVLSQEQDAKIAVDGVEISEHAYYARADLDRLLIARLAVRMHAAIDARALGQCAYLEHGAPVGL